MNQKKVIDRILEELPYTMRLKAEKALEKYKAEQREPLTLDLVRELNQKVINEQAKR